MSFTGNLHEIVERNENGLLGAHSSWARVRLGDVAAILNGFPFDSKHFSKSEGVPLIRIRDILGDSTDIRYAGPVPEGYWVNRGDLLVGMDGDFNCARWRGDSALLNQRVCKIAGDPTYIVPSFLARVLGGYLAAINSQTSSITVKHLSSKTIAELPLPYPPLPEQQRIADKLDTLLARVDACREHLDRVPAILKRFRQSVLAAATSGELTREWREEHGVDEGWVQTTLGDVIKVSSGKFLPAKEMAEGGTIPVFGGNGVNGHHDKANVGEETLVIGRVGFYCGSVHLTPQRAWVTDNALIVRHDPARTLQRFLYVALQSLDLRANDSSTAQPVISGAKIYPTPIAIPLLAEQAEIVRRVDALFEIATRLDERLSSARAIIERTTPSTLAKAFRGQLVPQDPNDEPAAALLARIAAQRDDAGVARRSKRAKASEPALPHRSDAPPARSADAR